MPDSAHLKRFGIDGTVFAVLSEPWFSRLYTAEVFQNLWRILESRKNDLIFTCLNLPYPWGIGILGACRGEV